MKRAALICLACLYAILVAMPAASAQYTTTVSIDRCNMDYQDINLSFDRPNYKAKWKSKDGKDYFIGPSSTNGACTIPFFKVPKSGSSSDVCTVGASKEEIDVYNVRSLDQVCDPSRVIVNDGQPLLISSTSNNPLKNPPGPTRLDQKRQVNIDEACLPSAIPNLYLSDKTTLVWSAKNPTSKKVFSIHFDTDIPCLDKNGKPQPDYSVKSGAASSNDICKVNTSLAPKDAISYTVSNADLNCKKAGYVNIRP